MTYITVIFLCIYSKLKIAYYGSVNYKETTQVPNIYIDKYIPQLKPTEAIILLIIIRQTLGWYDPKTKKRKVRDWISYRQFKTKTGLSIKTISKGINHLVQQNIIKATDKYGNVLSTSIERKGKVGIYYQCLFGGRQKSTCTYVKKGREPRKNLPITKLTLTKLKKQKGNVKKISDTQRISEILQKNNVP